MVKRKLDGAVDEFSVDREKFVTRMQLYITCEKSGGLHLAEPGLTAGTQGGRQMKFRQGLIF